MFEPLWRFLVWVMGMPKLDAEEIIQDTLFKVHSNVGKFKKKEGAKFTTWVVEIARNLAIDFHRKSNPREQSIDDNFQPVVPDGDLAYRNRPYLVWLADELAKLPSDVQDILLWLADGCIYKEIGWRLGIRPATARTKYMRGKNKLIEAADSSGFSDGIARHDTVESGDLHE